MRSILSVVKQRRKSNGSDLPVIDMHVHVGGPAGENDSMYHWSRKFTHSPSFEAMKLVIKVGESDFSGPRYIDVVLQQLKTSRHVDKVVLLALDHVYSESGELQLPKSHLFVSDDYLYYLSRIFPQLLPSCSVHPYAPNALERLYANAARGALFCKWVPSSQVIDPTHPLAQRFYRACAELDLPILIHVGPEEAIPTALKTEKARLFDAACGMYASEPGDAIEMALEAKATVIIAHCATPLGNLLDKHNSYWEGVFEKLIARLQVEKSKRLYADLSAFCLPGRFRYIKRILDLAKQFPERFFYGSDYPIPIISFRDGKGLEEILDTFGWLAGRVVPGNDFDKNFQLLKPHFPDAVFTSANQLLKKADRKLASRDGFFKRLDVKKKRFFFFKR
ncbi:amidohydrolase family protein [candidate division KSB1 bacterium]|nr:amidohydrolase family protein [candidate division KSB1 bacterium]